MALNKRQYDELARYFEFDTWRDVNRLSTNLFILNFFVTGKEIELAEWSSSDVERIKPREEAGIPVTLSVWHKSMGKNLASISMRIHECADRAAAHRLLLEHLSFFQSPDIFQLKESEIGDVVFGNASHHFLLFARANLIVMMTNASRNLIRVDEFATKVDNYLANEPSSSVHANTPFVEPVRSMTVIKSVQHKPPAWQLNVIESPQVWYKFYAPSGDFKNHKGQLHYKPHPKVETSTLKAYAVMPGGPSVQQDLTIKD